MTLRAKNGEGVGPFDRLSKSQSCGSSSRFMPIKFNHKFYRKFRLQVNSILQILSKCRLDFRGVEEAFQLPDSSGMSHFAQGLGFNLPYPFTGHPELAAYFFKGPAISINQSKALFQHLPLSFGQCFENVFDFFLQEHNRSDITWIFRALVLDKISKISLLALPHW